MKLKHLAAALLAAAAVAPAYADINNGGGIGATSGNGELFLSVWHSGADGIAGNADDVSYTLDLGITLNQFASAAATPVAVAPQPSFSFTADALMTSFLAGAADTGSITWNIVGFDNSGADRIITTADAGFTGSNLTYSLFRTAGGNGNTFVSQLNGIMPGETATTADNSSITVTGFTSVGFAGQPAAFADDIGGGLDFSNVGNIGETLAFWMLSETSASADANTKVTNLNFANNGWTLASNGTLTYGALAAPVPEADTWAMLLAGLGMVGFMARRRKLV